MPSFNFHRQGARALGNLLFFGLLFYRKPDEVFGDNRESWQVVFGCVRFRIFCQKPSQSRGLSGCLRASPLAEGKACPPQAGDSDPTTENCKWCPPGIGKNWQIGYDATLRGPSGGWPAIVDMDNRKAKDSHIQTIDKGIDEPHIIVLIYGSIKGNREK